MLEICQERFEFTDDDLKKWHEFPHLKKVMLELVLLLFGGFQFDVPLVFSLSMFEMELVQRKCTLGGLGTWNQLQKQHIIII